MSLSSRRRPSHGHASAVATNAINTSASSYSSWSDGAIRAETFQGHWGQLRGITHKDTVPTTDDLVAVLNLLAQMTSLIQLELDELRCLQESQSDLQDASQDELVVGEETMQLDSMTFTDSPVPCLDILMSENVLNHVLGTSRMPIDAHHDDLLRRQQLSLYECILASRTSEYTDKLLTTQPFIKPLLEIINSFASRTDASSADFQTSKETEIVLVSVLGELCRRLMKNLDLLDFFFKASSSTAPNCNNNESQATDSSSSDFLIFNILLKYLHTEGPVGQQARDALLHCMSLSRRHEEVGKYIAKNSNFCTVLATGLSGLYSLLPRRLPRIMEEDPAWFRLRVNYLDDEVDDDLTPELRSFLSSLEFCDAVLQVAHPWVRELLLGLIYMGFLVPVLGPAITQNAEAELICTTAYVDLFLRRLTEPSLMAVFLRFLFTESVDDKSIIDTITVRLSSHTKLCQVTLSLFQTFVSLNCEDILLWLIFRHLIPLKHILPTQRDAIRKPDLHGRAADKLLGLTPICCLEATTNYEEQQKKSSSVVSQLPQFLVGLGGGHNEDGLEDYDNPMNRKRQNYRLYLKAARSKVREKFEASQCWLYDYDGLRPPLDALVENPTEADRAFKESNQNGSQVCDTSQDKELSVPQLTNLGSDTAPSSGYTSLNNIPSNSGSPPEEVGAAAEADSSAGPLTEDEDREFWTLMKDPSVSEQKLNKVIQRMQHMPQLDELSLSSGGSEISPRPMGPGELQGTSGKKSIPQSVIPSDDMAHKKDDIDFTITSLGCFLDLLFEKVELMASNTLTTNLLVTSILSELAAFPQPLLKSVLIHPDLVFQPSVRGLFTAISSLRQKLDNIMPTLKDGEEGIILARKYLAERVSEEEKGKSKKDSVIANNMAAVSSTISHIGQEARAHKTSITAAITSMFSGRKSSSNNSSPLTRSQSQMTSSASLHNIGGSGSVTRSPGSSFHPHDTSVSLPPMSPNVLIDEGASGYFRHLNREVRSHALAAVILEEWLQELAALAQEHCVLQKEHAFELGMGLSSIGASEANTYSATNSLKKVPAR